MKFKGFAFSAALFLVCITSFAEDFSETGGGISYGLSFKSYEVTQDERTSLNLTPNSSVSAEKGFSIEFDLKIRYGFSFGYIFRFIDDRLNHLDFCSNHNAGRYSFIFGNNEDVLNNVEMDMEDGCAEHHVKVSIAPGADCFVCSVDSAEVVVGVSDCSLGKFKLLFGCIDNDRYFTTDIPRFTIKNVVLRNGSGKVIADWPMSRHGENEVFDIVHNKKACVKNAVWKIDRHSKWSRQKVFNLPVSEIGLAYSSDGSDIYIVSDSLLTVYDTRDGRAVIHKSLLGTMPVDAGAVLIYEGADDMLFTATPKLSGIQTYDLVRDKWSARGEGTILPISNHSGVWFNDSLRTVFFIGGYGMHRFYNELHAFDLNGNGGWTSIRTAMTPRYLCAAGEYDGSLLVAGGYGSRSGLQEEDPHNLYDILRVDTVTGSCDTLASISRPHDGSQFVFSSSFVPDEADSCFYSLIFDNERFNSEVRLARIDVKTGDVECFAEALPFKFHDLSSYCHIFRGGERRDSLFAVLTQPQGDSGYEVSIYTMAYPPLHLSDIIVGHKSFPWILLIVAIVLVSGAVICLVMRWSAKGNVDAGGLYPVVETICVSKSFIRLLGGFQVIDAKGNDITGEFSPVLKGVLSFIILRYGKDGKGLGNAVLDAAFWPYMEHAKALNNRRVNLSKLRAILMKVGDIRLDSRDGYVDFSLSDRVYCDYLALVEAIRLSRVKDVVAIGSLGPLLPDLSYYCLTEFKNDLTLRLSDFLFKTGGGSGRDGLVTQVKLADIVLLHDAIDENAVAVKCQALYALGQKGLSKSAYDAFVSQYVSLLGTEPDFTYSDILKNNNMFR